VANAKMVLVDGEDGLWIPTRLLKAFADSVSHVLERDDLIFGADEDLSSESHLRLLQKLLTDGLKHGSQRN
jgi:hypothetical protein